MIELNRIYNEDCRDTMKRMPDKSVDLIVTDPPYGIDAANYKRANTKHGKSKAVCKDYGISDWDKSIPKKEIFDEMFRISKNQIIFGGNYFIQYLKNSSCWIVWDKDNGDNNYADCELLYTSFQSAVRKIKWKWHGMLQENMGSKKEERFHPTQKPVGLLVRILKMYSKETDLIYDPFVGSGTTAIAAIKLNRRFIGSEISKEYCDIANKRIKQELSQCDMFRTVEYE